MTVSELFQIKYWDVYPKKIQVSTAWWDQIIRISIRGQLYDTPIFESADTGIARVDSDGTVYAGGQMGATVIMVYDSWMRLSVRYVQVEAIEGLGGY